MEVLSQDIKQTKFKNFYLLTGNDTFLINSYKNRLFSLISQENTLNQMRLEGEKFDVDVLIDAANTLPFLGDARCILVENSNLFKGKVGKSEGKGKAKHNNKVGRLLEAIDVFPSTTFIIFVESNVGKDSALYKKIAKIGHVAMLDHLNKKQLTDWVLRRLHQNSKKITSGNMNLFLDSVGDDMERVKNELDKLMAYTMGKNVIEQEDIKKVTTINIDTKTYEMIEDITMGYVEAAVKKYMELMDFNTGYTYIISSIAKRFNQIMIAKSMLERNISSKDMADKIGVHPFVAGKLVTQGKRYTMQRLKEVLNHILDLEKAYKSGEMNGDDVCVLMITGSGV